MDDRPAHAPESRPERSARENLRTVGVVGLLAIAVLFALLNLNDVKVNWIFTSTKTPLIVVIVVAFLLGAATALVGQRVRRARR
jgi:uncharacterized integral membrane protein